MASRFVFSQMKGQMMRAATDEATNAVSHVLGIGSLGLFSHTINPVNLRHLPHVRSGRPQDMLWAMAETFGQR